MKDRASKIILILLGVLIAAGLIFFATGKIGNPVSDLLGRKTVNRMISGVYADKQLSITGSGYVTERGCYVISVSSERYPDEQFDIYTDAKGKYLSDTRESQVESGWNTAMRLTEEYDAAAELVFDHTGYDVTGAFATLAVDELGAEEPCIKMADLEPNGKYDVSQLGGEYGHINVSILDDAVDAKRVGEILLKLKKLFDLAEFRFATVTLSVTFSSEGQELSLNAETEIANFPYEEIYEENLTERIQAVMDAAKKEE